MYYLGVDGGGTKTRTLVCDASGRCLGSSLTGGSNPHFVGRDQALANLKEGFQRAMAGLSPGAVRRAALCVPGLSGLERETLEKLDLESSQTVVEADMWSTFYGALAKETGLVLLAGTGSFALGREASGQFVRIGGWGPVVGDAGSGHSLAVKALRAVTRLADGIGPATSLAEKVKAYYRISQLQELKAKVALDNISPLTRAVQEAALAGDPSASAILRETAEELVSLAACAWEKMTSPPTELALAGGLWDMGEPLLGPFQVLLGQRYPGLQAYPAKLPPAGGALLIALRADSVAWTSERLNRMQTTIPDERT